ncbi:MAG TPA: RNHCP domain-containing protein [Spirochaetota bacterium]|jgi:DNA-directed RNA polymerase subunit RPC12/RpoP|nr:RNHCP domain-containing protein [Spirochaetota bacterium]HPO44877.1 RNHCP domain-containing protein [Spirochaetota bacterium]
MSRIEYTSIHGSDAFVCGRCGAGVLPPESGTLHRNHCPECLWSRHVDHRTGDRLSVCGGMMEPIAVWARGGGEWALVHRCAKCGIVRVNRIAGDDNSLRLLGLATGPLRRLPFSLDVPAGASSSKGGRP